MKFSLPMRGSLFTYARNQAQFLDRHGNLESGQKRACRKIGESGPSRSHLLIGVKSQFALTTPH